MAFLMACCFACKKEMVPTYHQEDSVYFYYKDGKGQDVSLNDTAMRHSYYSFAYDLAKVSDTLFLPVRVSGERVERDRFVKIGIDTGTTALEGKHYEALADQYEIPAGEGMIMIPVILYNTDPALQNKTVSIHVKLEESSDFKLRLPQAITAQISFSSRLEQPSWWVYWQSDLGKYSRVKHQLFLISSGTVDMPNPSTDGGLIPKALYHIERYRTFLNNPIQWVAQNPDKGYVLSPREGGRDYDFYYEELPDRKFLLQYDAQVNAYIFVDENGNNIY